MMNRLRTDIYGQLSWFRSERLSEARVMVVGCGALGNEVLKNLALFGIEHLVVVDFDYVEESNLTRSILFTSEDAFLHRKKVEAVAKRLQGINPALKIKTIFGDVSYDVGLGLLRTMNVVIGCVDNRFARYNINRLCMRAGIPWVDGGIDGLEGSVRVFRPKRNCYACNLGTEGLRDLMLRMPCSGIIRRNANMGRSATTPIVASIIGAVEVQEALKLIHHEQLDSGELTSLCGKMFCYEGQHLTTKNVEFQAYDDNCPAHECWMPIIKSDIQSSCSVGSCIERLRSLLQEERIQICLNDCFVDYVESRDSGEQMNVMLPGRAVSDYIEEHTPLRGSFHGELYQHEYTEVDDKFPFPWLSLSAIGIPNWDVLQVQSDKGVAFVEMNEEH